MNPQIVDKPKPVQKAMVPPRMHPRAHQADGRQACTGLTPASPSASTESVRAWAQRPASTASTASTMDLKGYAMTAETQSLTLYRADGRSPQLVREKGGMQGKENKPLAEIKQLFATDPRGFEQSHVSNNLPYLVSTAADEEAGGYATNDRYLYKISVNGLYKFEQSPAARSRITRKPAIYANSPSLQDATIVLMATSKDTGEVDFFSGIPLEFITHCRAPGDNTFHGMGNSSGSL